MPNKINSDLQLAAELARLRLKDDVVNRDLCERLCAMSGAHLFCGRCGATKPLTIDLSLKYIAHGWPIHCRVTMEIRTAEKVRADG